MAPSIDVSTAPRFEDLLTSDISSSKSTITTTVHEIPAPTPHSTALVLDPKSVTQDFDALRFHAAAHTQLLSTDSSLSIPDSNSDSDAPLTYSTLLISAPYNNPGHYLDLSALPLPSSLFAQALTALQPTRPDYATAPYLQVLNFPTILSELRRLCTLTNTHWRRTSFYVVIFRSQLHPGVDQDWLYKLDYESHREACESGGLLKYWFGKADLSENGERRNLATCFWHSREDARKGGLGPWHAKARRAGRELYASIVFETGRLVIGDGAEEVSWEEWVD
jgi:hypothetical protein